VEIVTIVRLLLEGQLKYVLCVKIQVKTSCAEIYLYCVVYYVFVDRIYQWSGFVMPRTLKVN
jgi:hypothetical protein